ncbi:MAG: hypothetical protein A2622_08515 [Bdellovibrionales bacterium RIFCSPHIGHO2_01_FULL_40_29]|nr:MAG: hypothetical protein A2622_08515 [Bdellovibrionales bacterium RIFCSPHIGHO2_01_FULL_40_29]OFZ35532.1 MAG: hypothetical protein A3D17_07750 [Bdellovibrionales bacterium RIFCSPHIGHO2_02_FULL_40_15]
MNNKNLIEQIKKAALLDDKKRKDIRYKKAMAFLVKKGFLKTNINFEPYFQARVWVKDLIWAGQNVEPRILEVLPAAVLRLPKAFNHDNTKEELLLKQVLIDLREEKENGSDFLNMPYKKIKVWMNISLNDRRTKTLDNKKLMKTFRLTPQTIRKIELLKKKSGLSDAAIIEGLVDREIV